MTEEIIICLTIIYIVQAKGDEQMWCASARRKVMYAIMEEWLKTNSNKSTVKKLLSALSGPGWLDVKLRVETLLMENIAQC